MRGRIKIGKWTTEKELCGLMNLNSIDTSRMVNNIVGRRLKNCCRNATYKKLWDTEEEMWSGADLLGGALDQLRNLMELWRRTTIYIFCRPIFAILLTNTHIRRVTSHSNKMAIQNTCPKSSKNWSQNNILSWCSGQLRVLISILSKICGR